MSAQRRREVVDVAVVYVRTTRKDRGLPALPAHRLEILRTNLEQLLRFSVGETTEPVKPA